MNPIVGWINWFSERPRLRRAIFYTALGVFILYDVYAPRHEAHFVGDRIRGFWAAFGFLGCIVLARVMKGIGHLFLMQPVDFYTRKDEEE